MSDIYWAVIVFYSKIIWGTSNEYCVSGYYKSTKCLSHWILTFHLTITFKQIFYFFAYKANVIFFLLMLMPVFIIDRTTICW